MKKQLIIFSALLFSVMGFSQGIEFEHGTLKEVLEKAKQINKPLFINVFTSGSVPCNRMTKEVFSLVEVGKVYNTSFVCYQIDAEKGEGIEVAKKYEVKSYPTYLFIKADGTLFSFGIGLKWVNDFIGMSKSALVDMNDTKPLALWENEYAEKKSNPVFLLDYIKKRSKLGKSNTLLFDEYLKLLPEERRTSDTIVGMYKNEGHHIKANSLAYKNLQQNKEKFSLTLHSHVISYLSDGIANSINEAAQLKDEKLLNVAIQAFIERKNDPFIVTRDQLYMNYYKQTGETSKYMNYATTFCNEKLMNLTLDSIAKKDNERLQQFNNRVDSGKYKGADSERIAILKVYYTHSHRNLFSEQLNTIAKEVFEMISDKNDLQTALNWSKRSLEIYPNNPFFLNTYANLLYKLGQQENAILKEEEAIRYANNYNVKTFENTLVKMKAGEKTWK